MSHILSGIPDITIASDSVTGRLSYNPIADIHIVVHQLFSELILRFFLYNVVTIRTWEILFLYDHFFFSSKAIHLVHKFFSKLICLPLLSPATARHRPLPGHFPNLIVLGLQRSPRPLASTLQGSSWQSYPDLRVRSILSITAALFTIPNMIF